MKVIFSFIIVVTGKSKYREIENVPIVKLPGIEARISVVYKNNNFHERLNRLNGETK
jgi:hypothetical protein